MNRSNKLYQNRNKNSTFWLPGVSCLVNIDGLDKAGRLSRSSISLSNGFLVISSLDIKEHSSSVPHRVAKDIAN